MSHTFATISSNKLFFLADDDGSISREFGAAEMPRTVVLDPMLRSIADIAWDNPQGHTETVGNVLRSLPPVDDAAGVPMFAPALIVPRVFSFELCDFLVQFYEGQGGTDSGFQFDISGKTTTISDWRLKRRSDVPVAAAEVRELVRGQIVRRLLPQIEQNFQFKATRMDRYIVACYDAEVGGHFHRHRDNVNAGAQHRRFAVSINLNNNFEGCDLMFPEFGRKTYRPPEGGALVFSCGALHQVTPVTKGRRYAFLAFLYGEEDAKKREANNSRLHAGETAIYRRPGQAVSRRSRAGRHGRGRIAARRGGSLGQSRKRAAVKIILGFPRAYRGRSVSSGRFWMRHEPKWNPAACRTGRIGNVPGS